MYTAFDFINRCIPKSKMRFGWKVEITRSSSALGEPKIVLRYDMLNFDWKSFEWLGFEAMNMFLASESYKTMHDKRSAAMKKYKRLYYDARSICELKALVEEAGLSVDLDKMVSKAIRRKAESQREKINSRMQDSVS